MTAEGKVEEVTKHRNCAKDKVDQQIENQSELDRQAKIKFARKVEVKEPHDCGKNITCNGHQANQAIQTDAETKNFDLVIQPRGDRICPVERRALFVGEIEIIKLVLSHAFLLLSLAL